MYVYNKNYNSVGGGNASVRQSSRITLGGNEIFFSSSGSDSSSSSGSYFFSSGKSNASSRSSVSSHEKHDKSRTARSSGAQIPLRDLIAGDKLWPSDKDHLNVYFLNGSTAEQSLVKDLIRKHYNSLPMRIQFKFLAQGELHRSDIRLEFSTESWSYIGIDARSYPGQKTMRLNMHPRRSTEAGVRAKIQADILHEFGHALGMVHAHKHPDCKANWNHQRLMSNNNWSLEKVRRNYDRNTASVIGKTWDLPYDPLSIMHYAIQRGDTHSYITEVEENTVLSDGDRAMLLKRYPRREERETRTRTKTKHEVSKELVTIPEKKTKKSVEKKSVPLPKEKKKQEPSVSGPVYVSGNSSSTVRGGHVVVSGNASATVKGGGYVVVSGNAGAIVYGDSNVRVSGNGSVYVHGNGTAVVSGNGSARFSGKGTGKTSGNGSISSYV